MNNVAVFILNAVVACAVLVLTLVLAPFVYLLGLLVNRGD